MTTTAREQTARLAELLDREHAAMADFLLALADFDRKLLWQALGYASLFSFLRRELRLSAGAAQYRKTAAELVQRYPQVEAALRAGDLCLSSVIELAKVITPENVDELLPRFFGLSARDAAAVAVSIRPVQDPPRRELVTVLPAAVLVAPADAAARGATLDEGAADPFRTSELNRPVQAVALPTPAPARPRPPSIEIEPLSGELRRLHVTVPTRLVEKLEAARAALSHSHPGAETGDILEVGLDLIIRRFEKRRGLVKKPRPLKAKPSPAPRAPGDELPDSRGGCGEEVAPPAPSVARVEPAEPPVRKREPIPAQVKRAVWLRDGGRCQWPVEGGGVCGSTLRVEIDHVVPVGRGGSSGVEDLRCLCDFHNQLAARQVYGDVHMDRFTNRDGCSTEASPRA